MGVYDRQVASAQAKIKAKGQLVQWVQENFAISGGQPWKTTAVANPPTYPVSIVFLSQGKSEIEALFHALKGTSVPQGAPKGLMGAVPFTPAINDTIIRGSVNLKVKAIDQVAVNGEVILWKIEFA